MCELQCDLHQHQKQPVKQKNLISAPVSALLIPSQFKLNILLNAANQIITMK